MMNKYKLVFVCPVTNSSDNSNYEYDFLFSETPDVVWGVDWNDNAPNLCGDITPEPSTYSLVKRVKSPFELKVLQENTCYSMEYGINYNLLNNSKKIKYYDDIFALERCKKRTTRCKCKMFMFNK